MKPAPLDVTTLKIDDLASPAYREVLDQKHQMEKWGNGGKGWVDVVHLFATVVKAESILDYGCGTGALKDSYERLGWLTPIFNYDPGKPKWADLPGPADLVVSTDVLEHIEPELLDNVLTHMFSLANKGMFLNIALSPARTILPDGRNAHLIVQPAEWWLEKLDQHVDAFPGWKIYDYAPVKGLRVWLAKEAK